MRRRIRELRLRGVTTWLEYSSGDVDDEILADGPPGFQLQPRSNTEDPSRPNIPHLLAAHLRTKQRRRVLSPTQAHVVNI
ncbi:hypothetical protein Tco_1171319 [Tanacetum coccineum]